MAAYSITSHVRANDMAAKPAKVKNVAAVKNDALYVSISPYKLLD